MTTALATRDGEVVLSASEVELVKRTVAKDATDEELRLFLHDCRRQGVHPLDKLIHFTKRGGRYTPITSIDFMRMRAADTGELAGNDDPTYAFKDGETVLPITASVVVWRLVQGVRCPFTATARWAEYKPPQGQDMMWLKMPQLMLGKCAEALALRKAFPKQLHGIYERAEMAQAGVGDGDSRVHDAVANTRPLPRSQPGISQPDERGKNRTESDRVTPPGVPDAIQEHRADVDEATRLFPDPQADVERERLLNDVRRLGDSLKLKPQDRLALWDTHIGKGVNPSQADPSALADLLTALQARAGEVTPKIIGINERWYPVGGSGGMERKPVTVVLVAGAIGDYAAYAGVGDKSHAEDIARFGDKISFAEAECHFPIGLEEKRYRV